MAKIDTAKLGEYIREQRSSAQISLRQLAKAADVSNPYLSQVERGLRKPSAEILSRIAEGLRISAETLYVRAGILEDRAGDHAVLIAIGVVLSDAAPMGLFAIAAVVITAVYLLDLRPKILEITGQR